MTPEFVPFPKIGRWTSNKIAVTEKIDGTNGVIDIRLVVGRTHNNGVTQTIATQDDPTILASWWGAESPIPLVIAGTPVEDCFVALRAGSRSRWLTRTADNFGFAKWVQENAEELVKLGFGTHYGEWWGAGIQRRYGLVDQDKRFSLFNVGRWVDSPNGVYDKNDLNPDKQPISAPGLGVVPTLYYGPMRDAAGGCMIAATKQRLQFAGSQAAPGFMNPEGVMIYFENLKQYAKDPFKEGPKGEG